MLKESKIVELKREYVEDIKKTVAAFANSEGGTLYIGVNDDGSIKGIEEADETLLKVNNALRDGIRPDVMMFVKCDQVLMEGKSVITVAVQRGTARPYYLQGKGIRPEGVFVRQGAATVPASEGAIIEMIKETSGDSYETARSLLQELTFEKTAACFQKCGLEFGPRQMRTLHLIGEDGAYTNLAFLLSEQCTHTIKLAVFEGSKKTVFKDREELFGPLLEQVEAAFSYIDRYNRIRAEFKGLERVESRDYPVEAVREALLNAVVHRDYSFSGPTLISIFDDRIEFVSIGGLMKGINLDDIKLGISVLRNQYLANIFFRLKLIEAYGTGIMKINECYDDAPVRPTLEATGNAFKLVLPNLNYTEEQKNGKEETSLQRGSGDISKNERSQNIIILCKEKGFVERRDIEAALKVSQATAIRLLGEMVKAGLLVKKGATKNSRYYLAGASR